MRHGPRANPTSDRPNVSLSTCTGSGIDGSNLRQLTEGVEDDFDPCPLPDGGVAFMSTRRGGFARCNNAWEPCASYTLHRMDADGGNLRRLSTHETSEWHPSVLNDGRLVFIRWDYVDRSAANFHGLWTRRPDGSGVASSFGNYTMRINACYQPRAIPGVGEDRVCRGGASPMWGVRWCSWIPRRTGFDPATGEGAGAVESLTPEVVFPELVGWPKSYFHSPWPLSEELFLVSFSHDPLPGMSLGEGRAGHTHGPLCFPPFALSNCYPGTPPSLEHVSHPADGAEESAGDSRPDHRRLGEEGEGEFGGGCPAQPSPDAFGSADSGVAGVPGFAEGRFPIRRTDPASGMRTRECSDAAGDRAGRRRMGPHTSGRRRAGRCISRRWMRPGGRFRACGA